MRTVIKVIYGGLLASALLLNSCQKVNVGVRPGEAVTFTAGSGVPGTKAAYSGATNSAGTVERIDWQVGDLLRVYCAQASEPAATHYADYKVKSVNAPLSGSAVSTARVEASNNDGGSLTWGEGDHYFYAAYPSPEAVGITTSISGNEVTASLSATQAPVSVTSSGLDKTAVPDLNNMLMTAKAGPYTAETFPDESTVFLAFTPLTTAIQFTITNQTKAALKLKSVSLTSASAPLNGPFTVDIDDESNQPETIDLGNTVVSYEYTYPNCQYTGTLTDASRTVTINFAEPVTLPYDADIANCGTLTFTFFLQPTQYFDDLTFKLVKSDDSWMSTRLGYTDGTGIFFPNFKKSSVTGVFVPEGAQWTVKYGPVVEQWNNPGGISIDPMPEVGEGVTLVTSWDSGVEDNLTLKMPVYDFSLTNTAQRSVTFTNTTDAADLTVPITSKETISGTDPIDVGWIIRKVKVGSADEQDVNSTSFSNIGGLSAVQVNSGNDLRITASGRTPVIPGSHAYWTGSNGDWSPAGWSGTKATEDNPLDLSKFDFQTETTDNPMTTANCYIIRHAGTYKIPLVYGNAINNGATNEQAYKPTMASGGTSDYFLSTFQNHLGRGISSPFIENNKTSDYGSNYIQAQSATIVWQDNAEVIKDVKIVNGVSTGAAGSYTTSNVRYLQFTVDPETICQNNAIIAIKDGGEDIIWSWHIWTTNNPALLDEPIPVTNRTPQVYNFFPLYNLGWIDPSTYPSRDKVIITLAQKGSNKELEIEANQTPIPAAASNGVHYQFGRKDPMPTKDVVSGFEKQSAGSYGTSLKNAILKPGTYYYVSREDWCSATYCNLWTGNLNVNGGSVPAYLDQENSMIKTVYDPSPVGYKVPSPKAFSNFTTTGKNTTNTAQFNVQGGFSNGWSFYIDSHRTSTSYFPAAGQRDYNTGNLTQCGIYLNYWANTIYQKNAGYLLEATESKVNVNIYYNRSYGFSVRPVKE